MYRASATTTSLCTKKLHVAKARVKAHGRSNCRVMQAVHFSEPNRIEVVIVKILDDRIQQSDLMDLTV